MGMYFLSTDNMWRHLSASASLAQNHSESIEHRIFMSIDFSFGRIGPEHAVNYAEQVLTDIHNCKRKRIMA